MQPALLERLNEKNQISTRWIADATGKRINHVTDALLRIEDGRDFGHQKDSRGYITETWIPLPDALLLLAQFEGPKAAKARAFIREALEFYINEAPRLRAENASLKTNAKPMRALPKVSTIPFTTSVTRTRNLFGEDIFTRIRTKIAESALTPIEIMKAKRANLVLAAEGMLRKIERMDSEIEFFEQPAAQRLKLVEKK